MRLGIPFDLRSRYVGDIFQYPEMSGNGRGSGGHACTDEPRATGNGTFRLVIQVLSSKELNSLEAAFFVARNKKVPSVVF